ncbi:lipopolysaccharide biosynthesis protein [Clostridium cadaveris]|uniref:lipopolysaccharide biosynthesis protein n=1 Tax=Clostridium cadaveris TaxID=1529 RepID=UPI0015B6F557|nr:lipopolysaccharide biosynthesis protein [Clostridium cadaveris]NWK12051.1 lipopolysaccharide biosynthesis protein [Clostridium cadaveris]
MENKQLKNKIGNAAKWASITEILSKFITPITNMMLARMLAPEAFGVVTTVTMIFSFVDMFTDAGFQKYLVQHEFKKEKEKEESANVAFITNLFISIFLWFIIIIFRNSIAIIVGNPGLGNVIAIACIQLPLTSFSSIQMALYKRDLNFKTLFVSRIIRALIPLFVTIPMAIYGLGYWALIIGSICGEFSNVVILTIKSKWKPSLFYDFILLKNMFSFSLWTLLESISIWLTSWFDVFIIGNSFSQYYLGLYRNSLNMVNSLMAVVSAAIIPILFSSLSRLQNNEHAYKKTYYTMQRFVAYIIFPMGIGLFMYSDLATNIMLGNKWSEANNIVGIWSLMASIGIVFSNFNGEVYRSKGRPKLSFMYQIIHLCFLVPSCLIAKGYGFWPLVYTRALMRIQGTITGFIFMKVFMGFSIKNMLKNVCKPILCTLLMIGVVFLLKPISNSIGWSFFSIFISIIVYITCLTLISRDDFEEIIYFLKTNKKRKTDESDKLYK